MFKFYIVCIKACVFLSEAIEINEPFNIEIQGSDIQKTGVDYVGIDIKRTVSFFTNYKIINYSIMSSKIHVLSSLYWFK